MKKHIYDKFVENDSICISFSKNDHTKNTYDRFCKCSDSVSDIELPFTFRNGNKQSTLSVFSFSLSKWFEEFEYVDSQEKCLKFFERIAASGNGRGLQSYDYYVKSFGNFSKYDWASNPLIFMISDRLLICDTMRIIDKQFYRLDPISSDHSIYETHTLWYIIQQLIIYNNRPNVKIIKRKGYNDTQDSPIHTMCYHYGWDKCIDQQQAGLIGYSPRNVIRMMILHEFSWYSNTIQEAEATIAKARTDESELRSNLAELELKLSTSGF